MGYKKADEINQLEEINKAIEYVGYLQNKYSITRADIARYLGIHTRTFSDWCTGISICPYPVMLIAALEHIEERGGID